MLTLKINAAILFFMAEFTKNLSDNEAFKGFRIECVGASKDIRLTAMNYHNMIIFKQKNAIQDIFTFEPFTVVIPENVIKAIKPKKNRTSYVELVKDAEKVSLKNDGAEYGLSINEQEYPDIKGIVSKLNKEVEDKKGSHISSLPLSELVKFDFTKLWPDAQCGLHTYETFTAIEYVTLPDGIKAHGVIMQKNVWGYNHAYRDERKEEIFKEPFPNWIVMPCD